MPSQFSKLYAVTRESIRVSAALGLVTLKVPVTAESVKLRGSLINGYLPHAYICSNIVCIPQQSISIASLR